MMSYQNGYGQPQYGGGGGGGYGGYGGGGGGYGGRGRGGGGGRRDDRRGGRGGGGGGGRDSRPPPPENASNRMKKMVIKLGDDTDFDPIEDPPRLARVLRRAWKEGSVGVLEGFRISVTQQPHKHSYHLVLLLALSRRYISISNAEGEADADIVIGEKRKAEGGDGDDDIECGREVLEDLSRAFRTWVEGREWQNVRLSLQFLSLLVPANLVSSASLLTVYKSLLAVLEEVGGGGDRAERAVRAVGEGLIRSGKVLYETNPEDVEDLLSSIEGFITGRRENKSFFDPLSPILSASQAAEPTIDTLDNFLSALRALQANGFASPSVLSEYWVSSPLPEDNVQSEPYELVPVSMPPEMYDIDQETNSGEGQIGTIRFYADEVVPSPSTLEGWTLQSLILDLVNIYEVNRKDCAELLLKLKNIFPRDTFKPVVPPADIDQLTNISTWSLESLVISTLLGSMLTLPKSPYRLIYYSSVITELCKLSPNTVAPPVGRAVRKLFTLLGTDGLDVEIARRTSEWFAVHLSNFGFQWMWKEWIPELALPASHPRRAFMRRVVDLEIRLAYHDRILETLPEPLTAEDAHVITRDPPDPVWPYEKSDHPLHGEATELLRMFRQKTSSNDVIAHITALPNASSGPGEALYPAVRLMIVETILHLGSRSFSHFLNATERYIDVLRYLSPDPSSRKVLLEAIKNYWILSSQMRLVTIDKYLQYGILEGSDIIEWIFSNDSSSIGGGEEGDGWTDGQHWELLKMTLEKHSGRVMAIKRRLRVIEREDEAARARRAAEKLERGGDVGLEEDLTDDVDIRPESSKESQDAQTSLDIHSTRLEKLLLTTLKLFISSLIPSSASASAEEGEGDGNGGLAVVLKLLDSGEEGLWSIRAQWGWFREFVRLYRAQLTPLASVVESTILSSLSSSSSTTEDGVSASASAEIRAEKMVRDVWASVSGTA